MAQRGDPGPGRVAMTHTDRALAAVAGAVTTSALSMCIADTVTPLDVVKTRLQTQHAHGYAKFAEASTEVQHASTSTKSIIPCPVQEKARHTLYVSRTTPSYATFPVVLAPNGQAACVYPKKCTPSACEVETLLQRQRMNGMVDGFVKVARAEGLRGLWRGLVPTIAMTVPSQVTYMSCYDTFRKMILSVGMSEPQSPASETEETIPEFPYEMPVELDEPSPSLIRMPVLGASLVSGAFSRCVSATLVTPLELLRTRLQASHGRSSFTSVLEPLYREVQMHGFGVLWRGLSATLWRDVPFSAIYFTGYEAGKYVLTGAGFGESHTSTFWNEFSISFGVGATSGCFAAFITHPFDLVKTRLQAEAANRYPGSTPPASTVFSTLHRVMETDGVTGLFRGLTPRLAKVAPSCGIMIGSFEVVGRWLARSHVAS